MEAVCPDVSQNLASLDTCHVMFLALPVKGPINQSQRRHLMLMKAKAAGKYVCQSTSVNSEASFEDPMNNPINVRNYAEVEVEVYEERPHKAAWHSCAHRCNT